VSNTASHGPAAARLLTSASSCRSPRICCVPGTSRPSRPREKVVTCQPSPSACSATVRPRNQGPAKDQQPHEAKMPHPHDERPWQPRASKAHQHRKAMTAPIGTVLTNRRYRAPRRAQTMRSRWHSAHDRAASDRSRLGTGAAAHLPPPRPPCSGEMLTRKRQPLSVTGLAPSRHRTPADRLPSAGPAQTSATSRAPCLSAANSIARSTTPQSLWNAPPTAAMSSSAVPAGCSARHAATAARALSRSPGFSSRNLTAGCPPANPDQR
jgi:hypothetical protein